jgi:hypothetical protein
MIDMESLTLEQAKEGHRALWGWLAKTGGRDKQRWPGWAGYSGPAKNHCFACAMGSCLACPVEWPGGGCSGDNGLYSRWAQARTLEFRRELAARMRDLPWKHGA